VTNYVQRAGENARRRNFLSFTGETVELNIFPFQLDNWILPCKNGKKLPRLRYSVYFLKIPR